MPVLESISELVFYFYHMNLLLLRFKMAWNAFWLIPFRHQIQPYQIAGEIDVDKCDHRWVKSIKCQNPGKYYLAQKEVWLQIVETDYYHLCPTCAKQMEGAKEKLK